MREPGPMQNVHRQVRKTALLLKPIQLSRLLYCTPDQLVLLLYSTLYPLLYSINNSSSTYQWCTYIPAEVLLWGAACCRMRMYITSVLVAGPRVLGEALPASQGWRLIIYYCNYILSIYRGRVSVVTCGEWNLTKVIPDGLETKHVTGQFPVWWVRDLVRFLALKLCQKIRLYGNF